MVGENKTRPDASDADAVVIGTAEPRKHGASRLYVKSLETIDLGVLRKMPIKCIAAIRTEHPADAQ